jgi:hypothetical protein
MSMPDKWEYPWFAAWDLAFHAVALAHVDPAFAKYQLILLCREWFQHPNGALPALTADRAPALCITVTSRPVSLSCPTSPDSFGVDVPSASYLPHVPSTPWPPARFARSRPFGLSLLLDC